MRKFRIDEFPEDMPEFAKELVTALTGMKPEGREYTGFDLNLEGAKWIAVVQRPCGCTTVFALDDVADSLKELRRMFDENIGGLRIPYKPSAGTSVLLGIYRKVV